MERLIFSEEQSFRQSFVPWIMLASILVMLLGFGVSWYHEFQPGNYPNQAERHALIWSSLIAFVVMTAVFLFILSRKLITEIWTDGIRIKFMPFIRKTKYVGISEIVSAEVTKYNPIIEFGGWGVRKKLFSRKTAYNVSGRVGLRVHLKDGRQIVIGTQKENEIRRAVEKMMQNRIEKFEM